MHFPNRGTILELRWRMKDNRKDNPESQNMNLELFVYLILQITISPQMSKGMSASECWQ